MTAQDGGIESLDQHLLLLGFLVIAVIAGFNFGPEDTTVRLS